MTNILLVFRISRDINPSPPITNFKDLNKEVFLLGAIGILSGKCFIKSPYFFVDSFIAAAEDCPRYI